MFLIGLKIGRGCSNLLTGRDGNAGSVRMETRNRDPCGRNRSLIRPRRGPRSVCGRRRRSALSIGRSIGTRGLACVDELVGDVPPSFSDELKAGLRWAGMELPVLSFAARSFVEARRFPPSRCRARPSPGSSERSRGR